MKALYQPLPAHSFRLFELAPSSDVTNILEGELLVSSFSDNIQYQALSYVWGTSNDRKDVLISGIRTDISANLDRALRRVRDPFKPLKLWIDQVCIHQDDVREKAEQVGLMDKIYNGAVEVLVILCACNVLEEKPTEKQQRMQLFLEKVKELEKLPLDTHLAESSFHNDTEAVALVNAYTSCDWWSRMWTVQEFVFARRLTFIYHHVDFSGETLRYLCQWWNLHILTCCRFREDFTEMVSVEVSESVSRVHDIFELRKRHMDFNKIPSLLEMLVLTGDRSAGQPHDKFYSLASLTHIPQFLIDYTFTPVECYAKLTRHMIQASGRLDVLRCLNGANALPTVRRNAGTQADEVEGLPSWVPNWSVLRNGIGQKKLDQHHHILDNYRASGNSSLQIIESKELCLTLRGIQCTTIANVSSTFEHIEPSPAALIEIWACLTHFDSVISARHEDSFWSEADFHSISKSVLGSQGSLVSVISMLMNRHKLHGTDPNLVMIPKDDKRAQLLYQWLYKCLARDYENIDIAEQVFRRLKAKGCNTVEEKQHEMQGTITIALMAMRRHLITTTDGHYGVAPTSAQPGDSICVLYGGNTPFILRKVQAQKETQVAGDQASTPSSSSKRKRKRKRARKSRNHYQIIGEAYVHGLMCGEALEDVKRKRKHEEVFTLV